MTKIYTFEHDTLYSPPAPVAEIHVYSPETPEHEYTLTALVDSGADATILPISVLRQIDAPLVRMAALRDVHDKEVATPMYEVTLRLGEYTIHNIEAASSRQVDQVLLGRDVLQYLVVTLDGPAGVTEIRE